MEKKKKFKKKYP